MFSKQMYLKMFLKCLNASSDVSPEFSRKSIPKSWSRNTERLNSKLSYTFLHILRACFSISQPLSTLAPGLVALESRGIVTLPVWMDVATVSFLEIKRKFKIDFIHIHIHAVANPGGAPPP